MKNYINILRTNKNRVQPPAFPIRQQMIEGGQLNQYFMWFNETDTIKTVSVFTQEQSDCNDAYLLTDEGLIFKQYRDCDHECVTVLNSIIDIEKYLSRCTLLQQFTVNFVEARSQIPFIKENEFIVYDFAKGLYQKYLATVSIEDIIQEDIQLIDLIYKSKFYALGRVVLEDVQKTTRCSIKNMAFHESSFYPLNTDPCPRAAKYVTGSGVRNALSRENDPLVISAYQNVIHQAHQAFDYFGWKYQRSFLLTIGAHESVNWHSHLETKQTVSFLYLIGSDTRRPIFRTTNHNKNIEVGDYTVIVQDNTDEHEHTLDNPTDNLLFIWTFDKSPDVKKFTPASVDGYNLILC